MPLGNGSLSTAINRWRSIKAMRTPVAPRATPQTAIAQEGNDCPIIESAGNALTSPVVNDIPAADDATVWVMLFSSRL